MAQKKTQTLTIEVPTAPIERDNYTVDEIAEKLNVSSKTVRNRIKDGTIKATRIGRLLRIHEDEYNRVLKGA